MKSLSVFVDNGSGPIEMTRYELDATGRLVRLTRGVGIPSIELTAADAALAGIPPGVYKSIDGQDFLRAIAATYKPGGSRIWTVSK